MSKKHRKPRPRETSRIPSDASGIARIEYYRVGSWSDRPASEDAKPTAVMLEVQLAGKPDTMGIRFRSPAAVDELIKALLWHRSDVWPEYTSEFGS